MSKIQVYYKRRLLLERLSKYLINDHINIYFNKDTKLEFQAEIDDGDIFGSFKHNKISEFKEIDLKAVRNTIKHNTKNKTRDYCQQFEDNYSKILDNLNNNINRFELQTIIMGFIICKNSRYLNRQTQTYEAYTNFYFKTIDIRQIGEFFNEKLEDYNKEYINIRDLSDIMTDEFQNIIFFGPPGTGKSTQIKEVAKKLLEIKKETDIRRVTFHTEYSYGDFIGQYKPVIGFEEVDAKLFNEKKEGLPDKKKPYVYYDFVPGPFTLALLEAIRKEQDENVLLVIEEINRGNCAAIFGDIFQLLDRETKGINKGRSLYHIEISNEMSAYMLKELNWTQRDWIQYFEDGFRLPSNLFIYASMNTSDQSLFPVDSAFKRRWNMEYVGIDYKCKELRNKHLPKPYEDIKWLGFIKEVNTIILRTLKTEDKQIGQWFMGEITSDENIFLNKVLSYLWFDVVDGVKVGIFDHSIESYQDIIEKFNNNKKILNEILIDNLRKENNKEYENE